MGWWNSGYFCDRRSLVLESSNLLSALYCILWNKTQNLQAKDSALHINPYDKDALYMAQVLRQYGYTKEWRNSDLTGYIFTRYDGIVIL